MKNVKVITYTFLMGFVLSILNLSYFSEQMIIIGIRSLFLAVLERIYNEMEMNGYPSKGYKNVRVPFYFEKNFQNKYIALPVEIIILEKTINFGCILFSILLWTIGFFVSVDLYMFLGGYGLYCGIICVTAVFKFDFILFRKIFKRCTLHNWWYFWGFSAYKSPPQRTKLGACIIMKEDKKCRRVYYTVKVRKSGNVYNKVMYCGEDQCKTDREHTLYEIRGVRYIM